MVHTCVDSTIEELARLENEPLLTYPMKDQIKNLQVELKCLKMFFWCLPISEEAGKNFHLQSSMSTFISAVEVANKGLYFAGLNAIRKKLGRNWRLLTSNLLEKVEHFKSEIKKHCNFLFHLSLNSTNFSTDDEVLNFMDCMIMNLKDLNDSKDEVFAPLNNQIGSLEEKLSFFRKFVDFTVKRCSERQKLEDFLAHILAWANKAACLSFLFWLNKMDENMLCRMNMMLSDLTEDIRPCAPGVIQMYLGVLKGSKLSASDTFLMGEIVANFVDFLLENLALVFRDRIEIIREGLIIIMAFLMDSPKDYEDDGNQILTQVDAIIIEVVSLFSSVCLENMNENVIKEKNFLLSEVLGKIKTFQEVVREFYVYIPNTSEFYFLRSHGIGFIDLILENLKKMLKQNAIFIPFVKHKIVMVQEEMQSLRAFLNYIVDGRNEHEELKDLWRRIINVAYYAEHVTDLCSISNSPLWYNIICISIVIEEIRITKAEVENTKNKRIKDTGILAADMNSMHPFPAHASNSRMDEVVVGFDDEAETIIHHLVRGSAQLEIVSIIGMAGQGKTTLAKKVFDNPSIRYHFIQCAWCCVSQEYRHRSVLLELLSNVTELSRHEIFEMSDEELANRLRKCLIGRSFLIIMDDIWDVRAWDDLRGTFPNNNNGSRILFTSRIHNLSLQGECKCYFHPLRPFSEEECWELLKDKTFHKEESPQDLSQVGMEIAKKCKGLPLSIVLVAGLLARSKNNLDWWKQIARSLSSSLSIEGCMDIFELSYRHLPDYLKPCFLYFGAFAEDQKIRARKLTLLWISEGFIGRTDRSRLEDVAMEYLMDLVNHSLVIVNERSSEGGIKECYVHDLLRDFCLKKAKEENFLQLVHQYDFNTYPLYGCDVDMRRLCFHTSLTHVTDSHPICSPVHSILFIHRVQYIDSCFFRTFRLLKVLDMERLYLKSFDLKPLMLIVHLRYLAISGAIREIPSSIANLWNLETLIMTGPLLFEINIPHTIWQMKSLRHVNVWPSAYISLGAYEFEKLCQLDNVHTLSSIFLCLGRDTEKLLKRLPRLHKLRCTISQPMNHRGKRCKFLDFSSLSELEELILGYVGDVHSTKFGTRIPAIDFPRVLRKLTLFGFFLPRSAISAIGQLPNLMVLKLRSIAFVRHALYVKNGEFLNLKFLAVYHSEFEEWVVPTEPFPSLEQLVLTDCTKLEGIPSSFGEISTLKIIKLQGCCPNVEKSARKIFEEQQDMGNRELQLICW